MPHMELKRAQQLMKKRGVDCLVASTRHNVYYASGYKGSSLGTLWFPAMAVVPAAPALAPAMVVASFIARQAQEKSYISDIRSYPLGMPIIEADELIEEKMRDHPNLLKRSSLEHALSLLWDILIERGLHNGIIGIEKSSFTASAYSLLSSQHPGANFVEAESIFGELRQVKTEEELEALRVAAELAERGIQAVIDGGVLGVTIGELYLRYKRGVLQAATNANAMSLEAIRAEIGSGDYFGTVESLEYRVAKGDIIYIDNGVTAFGYNSDMGRTFSVGQPGDLQKRIYSALKAGIEQGLSRVKPGVKMKEIYRVIQETVKKSGLKWYARQNMGHMLGIGPGSSQEPPMISPDEETELEPNMVMCIENGAYLGRVGAFQIEEEVVVTPDGYKLLTKLPRDMVEL